MISFCSPKEPLSDTGGPVWAHELPYSAQLDGPAKGCGAQQLPGDNREREVCPHDWVQVGDILLKER